ncbi:MAG: hypothetical protein NTY23_12455 [Chloroflexi bacterium]|nr:hypothetical protein [Chloroflexota bacterium]
MTFVSIQLKRVRAWCDSGSFLIVVLAVLLVAAVYGLPAAGVGALCLAGGLLAIAAVAGVLWLIRFIVMRAGYDE